MLSISLFSHVKWFVEEDEIRDAALSSYERVLVTFLIIAGLIALYLAHKWFEPKLVNKKMLKFFAPASKYVPDIVRLSTAVLLVINATQGYIYAPNVENDGSIFHGIIVAVMVTSALFLFVGIARRMVGWIIVATYVASLFAISPVIDVLDHIEYVGIGLYLALAAPDKAVIYHYEVIKVRSKKLYELAPKLLVGLAGLDLIVLSFSEKLANVGLSTAFLADYDWNILAWAGVSDRWFIILAGVTEMLVGISLVFRRATRLTTIALLGLMTTTAIVLGAEEIYGHLFVIGVLAVVWLRPYKESRKRKTKTKRKSRKN